MKLRLTHNSIRIRVQRSELAQLQTEGRIKEAVTFPTSAAFQYEIAVHDGTEIEASHNESMISIKLPSDVAQPWFDSSQVGIETNLSLAGNGQLHVLIEKDFPCADRPNEDKSETFWELVDKPDAAC
ncbi:MAG: hypothetical protein R8G66_18340 [Cytophagales bacterium]|nr:hypothetical protein [Cytophagales bacterium]